MERPGFWSPGIPIPRAAPFAGGLEEVGEEALQRPHGAVQAQAGWMLGCGAQPRAVTRESAPASLGWPGGCYRTRGPQGGVIRSRGGRGLGWVLPVGLAARQGDVGATVTGKLGPPVREHSGCACMVGPSLPLTLCLLVAVTTSAADLEWSHFLAWFQIRGAILCSLSK